MSGTDEECIQGRRIQVVERRLPRRDGRVELRQMVVHPGSVLVLPVLDDGRIVMIRNWRFTVERSLIELPAGTLEAGEDPLACAARELEEETGFRAARLEPLLAFYAAPGTSDERMHVFVASDLSPSAQRLDPSEQIEVTPLAPAEVLERIRRNEVEDAKTISAILYFHTWSRIRG